MVIRVTFLAALGLAFSQAWAEDVKLAVTNYATKAEMIPVPDVEEQIIMKGD